MPWLRSSGFLHSRWLHKSHSSHPRCDSDLGEAANHEPKQNRSHSSWIGEWPERLAEFHRLFLTSNDRFNKCGLLDTLHLTSSIPSKSPSYLPRDCFDSSCRGVSERTEFALRCRLLRWPRLPLHEKVVSPIELGRGLDSPEDRQWEGLDRLPRHRHLSHELIEGYCSFQAEK